MNGNMMYCKDCGKEISKNAKVCPNCGCRYEDDVSISHKACAIGFSIIIPIIGFVLAIIGMYKGDKVCCRIALFLSILSWIIHIAYYSLCIMGA